MKATLRMAVPVLQIPAPGLSAADARELAVQGNEGEPATSIPEATENGETISQNPLIEGGLNG